MYGSLLYKVNSHLFMIINFLQSNRPPEPSRSFHASKSPVGPVGHLSPQHSQKNLTFGEVSELLKTLFLL